MIRGPTSIKAYQSLTTTARPYVTTVSPPLNATGVEGNTTIAVTLENLGSATPAMRVGGTGVTYASTTDGTATTLVLDNAQNIESLVLEMGDTMMAFDFNTLMDQVIAIDELGEDDIISFADVLGADEGARFDDFASVIDEVYNETLGEFSDMAGINLDAFEHVDDESNWQDTMVS